MPNLATEAVKSQYKTRVTMNIRLIDNGFILEVSKDKPDGYERVELSFPTLPKLLKAIGIFLRESENKGG